MEGGGDLQGQDHGVQGEVGSRGHKKRKAEEGCDIRDMRLIKNKRMISPAIVKMSRLFEKDVKNVTIENEVKVTQESKVTKIRNSLEEMMSDTKVRKTKFEVKRRTKKVMSVSESDKPMRLTMEKWASPSGAIKIAESDRYEVYEGMRNERISNLRKMSENKE